MKGIKNMAEKAGIKSGVQPLSKTAANFGEKVSEQRVLILIIRVVPVNQVQNTFFTKNTPKTTSKNGPVNRSENGLTRIRFYDMKRIPAL